MNKATESQSSPGFQNADRTPTNHKADPSAVATSGETDKSLKQVQNDITALVYLWEQELAVIDPAILYSRRNGQGRTIKQILGHLIDSASNNLHRIVHLQYRNSPLQFPDYANLGMNDRWIAVQNYQAEEWTLLIQHWKFSNMHLAHVIGQIDRAALGNVWVSALGESVTLIDMVVDYPRHFMLHLKEIEELLHQGSREPATDQGEGLASSRLAIEQIRYYTHKLNFEIDAWDLAELRKNDPSVVVIDTRSKEAYAAEHIAAALSFPHRRMTQASTADLDPRKTYVTYCDGIGCNASTKGALKLAELGFRTRELLGGLDWWKRDGYPIEGEAMVSSDIKLDCGCS